MNTARTLSGTVTLLTMLATINGCGESTVTTRVAPRDEPGPGLVMPEYMPGVAKPGAAAVVVSARFLSAPRGALDVLARKPNGDDEVSEEVEARIATGEIIALASPTLSLLDGQRSHAVVINQAAFIEDFKLVGTPGEGAAVVDPVVSVLDTGAVLDVAVRVEGDAIVLARLEPQLVIKIGTRTCVISVGGLAERVPCQEPVLLRAAAKVFELGVGDGDTVLVPLETEVQQFTCQARAFATSYEESYEPEPRSWGEGPRDLFLLATVSRARAEG